MYSRGSLYVYLQKMSVTPAQPSSAVLLLTTGTCEVGTRRASLVLVV